MARRFCVMTVGRTGSTSLMEALEAYADIAVPNKNGRCEDNELLHAARVRGYMERYAGLSGRAVRSAAQLIEAFFDHNEGMAFAGFKSMPNRHKDYAQFVARPDIRFITLERRDVASTAASFLRAEATGSWRRHGEAREDRWRFDPQRDGPRLKSNLGYIRDSRAQLAAVPGAIRLHYEDLCNPGYANAELDAYFGRPVRIANPRPATSGASYVENWDEFRAFVDEVWMAIEASPPGLAAPSAALPTLKTFCVVAGATHSGARLLGGLLDAHPAAIVSRRDDVLATANEGAAREAVVASLVEGARIAAAAAQPPGTARGGWQGRHRDPLVLGGIASEAGMALGGTAIGNLGRSCGLPVKLVHLQRDPVDTVALIASRLARPVPRVLGAYLGHLEAARKLLECLPAADRLELRYEDLCANPAEVLRRVCGFLGLACPEEYLAACARAVGGAKRDDRPLLAWPEESTAALAQALKSQPVLSPYASAKIPAPARRPREGSGGRVFYAWELGMDLGHLLRFLGPALKLRERGYEVAFAVRDLADAEATLGRHGFPLMQAPIWIAGSPLQGATISYCDIILRYGFMNYPGLKAMVKAWRELFLHARPGLVLADHSPSALLAARSLNLPFAPIGSGFFSPPNVRPLPQMRYWSAPPHDKLRKADALATMTANQVLADLGGRPLASIADLFVGAENFLCTFQELDHYPGRGPARYWGPTFEVEQGVELGWPRGSGPCVFAYLKPRYRDFNHVLDALTASGCRVVVYAPGIGREATAKYASARMKISRQPVKLRPLMGGCDLVICHGGPGTVTAALLSGVPVLILPTQLEQFLTSRRIEEMGSGLYVDAEKKKTPESGDAKAGKAAKKDDLSPAGDYPALIRKLLTDKGFRAKAKAFSEKYRSFSRERQAEEIAGRIEVLLQAPRR